MSKEPLPPLPAAAGIDAMTIVRGVGGALLGAAAGVAIFMLIMYLRIGIYPIAIIGGLTGLGCSLFSHRRSLLLGAICLGIALVTTFFNEWINNPFVPDTSFGFFVRHIKDAQLMWISLILGGGLAFWFGQGK